MAAGKFEFDTMDTYKVDGVTHKVHIHHPEIFVIST
jgi:hypothetical protein